MDSQTEITMVMSSLSLGPTVEVQRESSNSPPHVLSGLFSSLTVSPLTDNCFNPNPTALVPPPAALAPLPAHAPLPVPLPVEYQRNRDVDVTYFFQPLYFFNEQ